MCTLGAGDSKKGRFWGHETPSQGTHGALLHWEGSMWVAGAVLVPKYVVICACSISGLLFGVGDGETVGINQTLRAQQAGREIFGGERGEKCKAHALQPAVPGSPCTTTPNPIANPKSHRCPQWEMCGGVLKHVDPAGCGWGWILLGKIPQLGAGLAGEIVLRG